MDQKNFSDKDKSQADEIMKKAAVNDRRRKIKNFFQNLISFCGFIATVIITASLINHFIFQSYYVDGSSMLPTLEDSDRLIINKIDKTISNIQNNSYIPKRGQIIILDSSLLDQYGRDEQLIKRVIGLPKETVIIQDGKVTIQNNENPKGFDVDQSLNLDLGPTYSSHPINITLGENEVYVIGDNRAPNGSFDSRSFGPIKSEKIQGFLALRIFPLNKMKTF